jgi:predicted phage tail component-like protein
MSLLFNGVDLSQWIVITGIDIEDLPTTTPNAIDVGTAPGQTLLSNKFGPRTITLAYYLLDQRYKHDLAGALGSSNNQPAQLILGNDPDKYYMAVPAGGDSQNLGPIVGLVSGGSLTFTCYDPFIYSTSTVSATNKTSEYDGLPANLLTGTSQDNTTLTSNYSQSVPITGGNYYTLQGNIVDPGSGIPWTLAFDDGSSSNITLTAGGEFYTTAYASQKATTATVSATLQQDAKPVVFNSLKLSQGIATSDWCPADSEITGTYGNTLTITNPGSADAPVDLKATMNGDIGYLAASINGSGVQLGNPNGQATPDGDVSTKMFETYFWSPYTLTQNKYPGKVSSTASLKGSWAQANWEGVGYVYPNNYAEPSGASGQALYGTSFYMPFDQPRSHWAVNFHMLNYPLKNQALGYTEMFAVDSAGAPIFGYQFRKLNWANKYQQLILFIGDDVINTWTDEQHSSWIMEQFNGNLQLEQNGGAFTFRFRNGYTQAPWAKTLVYSNMANQQVAGINFYTGKFGGCDGFQTHVMGMVGTSYDTNWVQTSNLFQKNGTVEIDSDAFAPSVLVNGIPALDTMVPTSQPLIVPARSTTQINIDQTIGKQIPAVYATLRPRYI